jgi:hypothetical protein
VDGPPQEVQLDQQQRAQVPVQLQEPSVLDAECTPGVEEGRLELGEGRPELRPARGRQPAQPGGQLGPRRAPLGEHGTAAARRRQATERPQ